MLLAWIGIANAGPDTIARSGDLDTRGVRGLAWHDGLWALDPNRGGSIRSPDRSFALPDEVQAARGLAIRGGEAWVLDWREAETTSWLWRVDLVAGTATSASLAPVLGQGEALALAFDGDDLWLSFDGGLVRVPGADLGGSPVHLPASGVTRGLAFGEVDGVRYMFTATGDLVTVADRLTGRTLIAVPAPAAGLPPWGVACSDEHLWVAHRTKGEPGRADALELATLDDPVASPWRLRALTLTITSEPARRAPADPGWVEHVYGGIAPLANQQPVAGHRDVQASAGARRTDTIWHAADDPTLPQEETVFRWERPRRRLESQAELWVRTREVQQGIFPHRVTAEPPPGPGYTADSRVFNLDSTRTWAAFTDRVVAWISRRYSLTDAQVRAELNNPYWASRDVTEYIFATYLYPTSDHPSTTDLPRGHFHNSPADLKAALSGGRWTGDEITDCAGGNTLLGGALRYLGHPTRLLSSVFERAGEEFLVPGSPKPGVKAHHFSEVWMGGRYGWQVVDGTPDVKATTTLDRPPPPGQLTLVRSVAAPRAPHRVVLTVASGEHESMVRWFPPPAAEPGDQGYGFRGRYDNPGAWVYPVHAVTFGNPLGLQVEAERSGDDVVVHWEQRGPWELLEEATVTVALERWQGASRQGEPRVVGSGIPVAQGSLEVAVPHPAAGMHLRAVVLLDGDRQTGARSKPVAHDPRGTR